MTDQEIEVVAIEGGGQGQDQGALTGIAETLVVGETDSEETGDEIVCLFIQQLIFSHVYSQKHPYCTHFTVYFKYTQALVLKVI